MQDGKGLKARATHGLLKTAVIHGHSARQLAAAPTFLFRVAASDDLRRWAACLHAEIVCLPRGDCDLKDMAAAAVAAAKADCRASAEGAL